MRVRMRDVMLCSQRDPICSLCVSRTSLDLGYHLTVKVSRAFCLLNFALLRQKTLCSLVCRCLVCVVLLPALSSCLLFACGCRPSPSHWVHILGTAATSMCWFHQSGRMGGWVEASRVIVVHVKTAGACFSTNTNSFLVVVL